MTISPEEKRGMILGCIPFVSTVTGILKAKSTSKHFSVCRKAKSKSQLETLSDITARRLIDQNLDFYSEQKKLIKGYKSELACNIIETIPIIGNIVSLARSLYSYLHMPKTDAKHTAVRLVKEKQEPNVAAPKTTVAAIPAGNQKSPERGDISQPRAPEPERGEHALGRPAGIAATVEEKPTPTISEAKPTYPQLNIPGKKVYQIPVLNQYSLPGGFEQCGFHAFKNALVGIAVAKESQEIDKGAFTDVAQFNLLKAFADTFGPKKPGDASIVQLMDSLENLHDPKLMSHDSLQPYRSVVQAHFDSISMFNADGGLSGSSGGAASLHSLANLSQFQKQDPPKTHAFLLGMEKHWISLILNIDKQGKKVWQGMDSCADSSTERSFQKAIDLLEPVIDNPGTFIRKNYPDAIGEEISKKANWFTPEGKIKDKTNLGTLFKSAPEFLKMLARTYDFMKRSDWLTSQDPVIQGHVQDLRAYVRFYAQALKIPIESNEAVLEMCEGLHIVLGQNGEETAFGQPVTLTEEAMQAFKSIGGEGPSAVVPKATIHYYLSQDALTPTENFRDYGWGCAWRSIKTVLSALAVPDIPIKEIFKQFKHGWSLVQAYKNISPDLTRHERYQILSAAPEKWGNWAEPFIGQLVLAEHGTTSSLELYGGQTETMHTPEFVFRNPPIAQFSELAEKLFIHFNTYQSPVMIDNGRWAYSILGIKKSQDKIHLLVADPHTSNPNEALYTVTLDQTGKQLACSLQKKEEFPESSPLIRFHNAKWMMLFPQSSTSARY